MTWIKHSVRNPIFFVRALSAEQIADGDGISERTEPFYDQDFVTAAQDSPALRRFLFRQRI